MTPGRGGPRRVKVRGFLPLNHPYSGRRTRTDAVYTRGIYIAPRVVYSTSIVHPQLRLSMHTTRVFRNGNSQAVRIPAELAYERSDVEVEIERVGDELRIRPARRPLAGVLKKFAKFGPDFMAEGRGDQEQAEREAL
jgi:antitoxin VapB